MYCITIIKKIILSIILHFSEILYFTESSSIHAIFHLSSTTNQIWYSVLFGNLYTSLPVFYIRSLGLSNGTSVALVNKSSQKLKEKLQEN